MCTNRCSKSPHLCDWWNCQEDVPFAHLAVWKYSRGGFTRRNNFSKERSLMVSAILMVIGCCMASVPLSEAWWWQLPLLDRLRQGQNLMPWEEVPGENPTVPPSDNADEELKLLLMGQPKRGLTLLTNRENDSMNRIVKGRISKFRKMTEAGRPRGHPLRWG